MLSLMKKMSADVIDQNVCRKLEILMNSEKDDFPAPLLRRLLDLPSDFDPREVSEPYTQYVRHYVYMSKRAQKSAALKPSEAAGKAKRKAQS